MIKDKKKLVEVFFLFWKMILKGNEVIDFFWVFLFCFFSVSSLVILCLSLYSLLPGQSFFFPSFVNLALLSYSCCMLGGLCGILRINILGKWLSRLRKFNYILDFWLLVILCLSLYSLLLGQSFFFASFVNLALLRHSCCILEGLCEILQINILGKWLSCLRKFSYILDFRLQQHFIHHQTAPSINIYVCCHHH